MRWFARVRKHTRWAERRVAYIDGELSGEEAAQFDFHLVGCEACRMAVADERALKRLLAENLPESRAPRSFAITEAMLGQAVRPVRRTASAPALAMRFAQVAAVAAVIGLATLVVIDRGTNGSGNANRTAAPFSTESGAAAVTAGGANPEATPLRESDTSKSAVPAAPTSSTAGVPGQGAVPAGTAAAANSYDQAPVQPSGGTGPGGRVVSPAPASPGTSGGTDWIGIAEGALALITIAALAGYVVARHANRRSSDV